MKHNPSRLRRHLSTGNRPKRKSRFDTAKATEARRRLKWLNPDNLPFEQAMLWRSCNSRHLNARLFNKAMRLGADLSQPVEKSSGARALHCLCENSDSPLHARKLLAAGASLDDPDSNGRNCAHYAVSNMNSAMVGWLMASAPQLFEKPDSKGLTPLLESFGDGSFAWLFSDDSARFRQSIFDHLSVSAQREFLHDAFPVACARLACSIVPTYEDDLAWLYKIGARIPGRIELSAFLGNARAALYHKDLLEAMETYFALNEQTELCVATPEAPLSRPRSKSI